VTDSLVRYDLTSTFDIVVGKAPLQQQRFTVHTHVLTQRSEFLRAARSRLWLVDPAKPVDLEDDDPEIVSAYLSCVYFGVEALKADIEDEAPVVEDAGHAVLEDAFTWSQTECEKRDADLETEATSFETSCADHLLFLAKIYLQADKLGDLKTANLVVDEFIRLSKSTRQSPSDQITNHVYESTVHGSPFRKLMRDFKVHETSSDEYLGFHTIKYHEDVCRDITVEFLRAQDGDPVEPSKREHGPGLRQKICATAAITTFTILSFPGARRSSTRDHVPVQSHE
jgi:hypothetical protein